MANRVAIDVYFDYACPYVYAGAIWLKRVKDQLGDDLQIRWRCFPLEQVNSSEGPEWKMWEQGPDYVSRGRAAFLGALAARRQGEAAFDSFHYSLLVAKHEDGKNHGRESVILQTAEEAGLDMDQFAKDIADPRLLAEIGFDYEQGVSEYGVFGTPTLVFEDGNASYVKMLPTAPDEDVMAVWDMVSDFVTNRTYFAEIKRPSKPNDDE